MCIHCCDCTYNHTSTYSTTCNVTKTTIAKNTNRISMSESIEIYHVIFIIICILIFLLNIH